MSPIFVIFERFSQIMARPVKGHERLPPMPNGNEQATEPAAARLVQQMPNRAYKQRGAAPRDAAASSTTGLDGKLEGSGRARRWPFRSGISFECQKRSSV